MTFWIVIGVVVLVMTNLCRWEARTGRAQWGTRDGSSYDATNEAARAAKRMVGTTAAIGIGIGMGLDGDG